jgi:hypothetical protein
MCVRITAAGAVAFAFLTYLTAPVSACDERYIKKCEKAAAAAAGTEEQSAPAAKRKSAGRVQVVASRRVKHVRFVKRMRAPEFATRGRVLTSAESRMTPVQSESAMARRFRGFIDPTPIAQNAFEALRKPHVVALNLEPPVALAQEAAPIVAEAPAQAAPPAPVAAAKQDRIAPQPPAPQPTMELASAESKRVTLPDPAPAKPAFVAAASAAPAPAMPQAFFSAAAPQSDQPPSSGFPVHQLVIALCGALGAASALRFIVGA